MTAFITGITTPFIAAGLILRHPKLLLWSILPFAMTLGLYIFAFNEFDAFVTGTFASTSPASPWAGTTALWLGRIILGLVGIFCFSFVTVFFSAAFNDVLAQRTETFAHPALTPTPRLTFRGQARLIALDMAKTAMALFLTLLMWAISWVPIINLAAFACMTLLMAFQYLSYPQTRRGLGVQESFAQIFSNFFLVFGFGLPTVVLSSVPLLSALFLPLHVVGGTLVFAQFKRSK